MPHADRRRQRLIGAALVALTALAIWLSSGVSPGDALLFLGYEAAFVLAPGWLALRAVSPGTRSLGWQLALAWPLGLTLEVLAFSLTAALDARELLVAYPFVVAVPAAIVLRRRRARAAPGPQPPSLFPSPGPRWAVVALAVGTLVYLGATLFATIPLPDSLPSLSPGEGVEYHPDWTFYIALDAEAMNHWPIADPGVAGEPFAYHYFANLHVAAVSQVTGIDLATAQLRLFMVPVAALLVLQMGLAGRLIGGREWAGPLAIAMLLGVRAIDLAVYDPAPFTGGDLFTLAWNPSTVLGLVFLIPAVCLLYQLLDRSVAERAAPWLGSDRRRTVAILAILLVGAGGAKSVVLPLLIGGLVLFGAWQWLSRAGVDRIVPQLTGLCTGILAVYFVVLYGYGEAGLHLGAFATIEQMPVMIRLRQQIGDGFPADAAFWAIAIPVGTAMYMAAPMLGVMIAARGRAALGLPGTRLAISIFLAGLPSFFLLRHDFQSQAYIAYYGMAAALPLAAGGLLGFFGDPARRRALTPGRLAAFAAGWIALLALLAVAGDQVAAGDHPFRGDLVIYGALALALAGLGVAAALARGARRSLLSGLAVLAVLLTAASDVPIDYFPLARAIVRGETIVDRDPTGIDQPRLEAMRWIRDELPEDAVLAVSERRVPGERPLGAGSRDWAAFAERRTLREGWAYSQNGYKSDHHSEVFTGRKVLFKGRLRIERRAFLHGDLGAVRVMRRRYGVTHIVVDRRNGPVDGRLYRAGPVVYSNGAVDVIAL